MNPDPTITPPGKTPGTASATLPADEREQVLQALLDQGLQRHAPEYSRGLANHLPMLLHAQHALGATPEHLAASAEAYAARLAPREAVATAVPADWRALRGKLEAFEALRAHFDLALRRDGREHTLRTALPALMPGVAAGAFHGLIRTGHALEAGHDGELAAGLAYWAAGWAPLRAPRVAWPAMRLDLPDWLAALQALPGDEALPQDRILARMRAVAAWPGFDAAASALRVGPDTLHALAAHAAALYAATGNFTVLHALTASRAMALLWPRLADAPARSQALREFALALAAALHASRLRRFDPAEHGPPPAARPWAALREAAIAASDDHTAKLVHAAWQLARCWPEGPQGAGQCWAQAATRAVQGLT